MKILTYFFLAFTLIAVVGCGSANYYHDNTQSLSVGNDIGSLDPAIPLSSHLRRLPGVSVQGNGINAKVRMPGLKTFISDPEPLFVIDGRMVAGGYQSAVVSVDINDISSIRALRNINDRAKYGLRGSNGVIEIFTKN